jgi:hypothetical protein
MLRSQRMAAAKGIAVDNMAFRGLWTRSRLAAILLMLGAAGLAGCAQQARSKGSWQDNVSHDQSFKRVLIVGVSPDVNLRCAFESFLASTVQSESTKVLASCGVLPLKDPLSVEAIERVVAEHRIDAVLATILVAGKASAVQGGTSETRGDAYYKATDVGYGYGYYGVYGIPVVYGEFETAPPITTIKGEVEVLTKVFETGGPTLVYVVNTKARDLDSRAAALATIAGPIAERLRRDGLIR